MEDIILFFERIVRWVHAQNWWILFPAVMGYLNVIVAGTKVMGWTKISEFCVKLEDAIAAMIQAWINRKRNIDELKKVEEAKESPK